MTRSLKDLRTAREMSLRAVQDATLDITISEKPRIWAAHLSEIERGKRVPTPDQLVLLASIYEVDTEGWTLMYVHVQDDE